MSASRAAVNIMPGKLPLDESYYHLDDDELAFYQSQTGIADESALKEHISVVQADAYEVRERDLLTWITNSNVGSICG